MTRGARVGTANRFRSASWLERGVDRWLRGRASAAPAVLRRAFEAVLDRLPGDHLVSVMPEGERVRLSARYRHLTWNPLEYDAFRAVVRRGMTVLDVGANVGAYTLIFATWVGEQGRVFALEPASAAREGLRVHVALNNFDARVTIVDAAAAASVGRAPFAVHPSGGASSLTLAGFDPLDDVAQIIVATETIDNFCKVRRLTPAVIKIDVEGAELDVLKGARQTLALPGMHAFVEFHPAAWARAGIGHAEIEDELREQGFVAEPLEPSLDPWTTEGVAVRLRRR